MVSWPGFGIEACGLREEEGYERFPRTKELVLCFSTGVWLQRLIIARRLLSNAFGLRDEKDGVIRCEMSASRRQTADIRASLAV